MEGSSRGNPPRIDPMAGQQRMERLPQRRSATTSSMPATGGLAERTPSTTNVYGNRARDREPRLGAPTAPPARATTNDAGVAAAVSTQSTEGKPFILKRLPKDVQGEVLLHLDVLSMRRLYRIANDKCLLEAIGDHFKKRTVEVTSDHIIKGDHTKIDLKTLSLLPPCHAHIKTSAGMWELTKKWILSLKFWSLNITVQNEFPVIHEEVDLKGFEVKPFAMNFKGIRKLDTANIPISVKKLQITECTLKGGILDIGALAASLTTLVVVSTEVDNFPCASLLSNLQHYTGKYVADLPWSQLKTVIVDRIPDGIRCDSLEKVTLIRPIISTFKNIHCPNLTSVSFTLLQFGHISDYFNPDQLVRLKTFRGVNVELNDLTSLPNVEILHVTYDQTLSRHTALPPHLVELKIVSDSPVEGIPDQLTVFEYVTRTSDLGPRITVESTTLKRLLVVGANELMVECPYLEQLVLKDVRHSIVVGTSEVRKLSLVRAYLHLANLPNLRQLHLKEYHALGADFGDVVIDNHHLESVTLEWMTLGRVSFSADKVSLMFCEFTQNPSIDAVALDSWKSLRSGDGVSCQELVCKAIERIPKTVEKLRISGRGHIAADSLIGCDNLKALSIKYLAGEAQDTLYIPDSVEKLCLFDADESKVNVRPFQLKWYQRGLTPDKYIASGMLADSAVPLGPYLACKPEMLPPEQPPNRQ